MCVCIPTPRGCNLARREIICVITTSPLQMEKNDVAIFLVYLFDIFLASVFHGHFPLCCMLAVLYEGHTINFQTFFRMGTLLLVHT